MVKVGVYSAEQSWGQAGRAAHRNAGHDDNPLKAIHTGQVPQLGILWYNDVMNTSETFVTYLGKFLGLALIAGAVVHFGTIGGGYLRYVVTAVAGLTMMVIANVAEGRRSGLKMNASFFAAVTILSVATGFLSGGIQHYIDNPRYAGWLLVVGLTIAFSAYHRVKLSRQSAVARLVIYGLAVLLVVVTLTLPDKAAPSHHSPAKSVEVQEGHH